MRPVLALGHIKSVHRLDTLYKFRCLHYLLSKLWTLQTCEENMAYTYIAVPVWSEYEWIILHIELLQEEETKKTPRPEGGKNVTLMNILRELLSTAKTVEVEGKHLSQRLKRSQALQLSALLRQSQHTPAKLFLNNHPAVLKAARILFFSVCYLCSSQFGGQVQFGWCDYSTLTKTCC